MNGLYYSLALILGLADAQANITPRFDIHVVDSVLPDGAATSSKQDDQTAQLITVNGHLTTLEAYLDGVEPKLDTANSNLVSFQSANHADLLALIAQATAINTNTDGLEGLISTTNSTLSTRLDVNLSTRASETTLSSIDIKVATAANQSTLNTRVGDLTETAPATDTASSGLNGRLQRIAQSLTSLVAFYAANFGTSTGAIRTAAQIGNATGAADFNLGATGAQTPRTNANINGVVRTSQPTAGINGEVMQATVSRFGALGVVQFQTLRTEWGKMFLGTSNYLSTGATAETNLILLRNPAASGIVCGINYIGWASPSSGEALYRMYQNPTVTGNGTTIVTAGGRSSGNSSSTCVLSSLPTTSARGTVFRTARAANQATDFADRMNYEYLIYPNTAVLITVVQGLMGQAGSANIQWGEHAE